MKNHKHVIRLIVLTAILVALGVFAFKFMRTYSNIEQGYQTKTTQDDKNLQQDVTESSDGVVIQSSSCIHGANPCKMGGTPCCKPFFCQSNGYCQKT